MLLFRGDAAQGRLRQSLCRDRLCLRPASHRNRGADPVKAVLTSGAGIASFAAAMLLIGPIPGDARDYGHVGQVFPILEPDRSEEGRVGKECCSTVRNRGLTR